MQSVTQSHGRGGVTQKLRNRRVARALLAAAAAAAAGAAMELASVASAASGTWSFLGNGSWSFASNWATGVVADGASSIADFSTLNITADTLVNLDTSRTVGALRFADATTQSNNWTLDNNGSAANVLTLDNGASAPVITVGNGTTPTGQLTTISAVIAGTNGFTKTGPGALQLTGNNTFTGQVTFNSTFTNVAAPGTPTTPNADLILGSNSALGAATNVLFIDPGSGVLRVRAGAGLVIPNPITIRTSRSPQGNGILQPLGNVSATFSGPITIDAQVGVGGTMSGPNDTTLTEFLSITGPITLSSTYTSVAGNMTNTNNNGVVIRTGNVKFSGGGNYFRLEVRTGDARLAATNGISTNAYVDLGQNSQNPTTSVSATLDLFGFSQTLRGVCNIATLTNNQATNGATVTNTATTPSTLTLTPGVVVTGEAAAPTLTLQSGNGTASNVTITDNAGGGGTLNIVVNGTATGLQTFNTPTSSYHGSTVLTSGILGVNTLADGGSNSSIGASDNGATNLVFDGGTLRYTGTTTSTNRNFTINSGKTAALEVTSSASTLSISGGGIGAGGLTKTGPGTLRLGGNNTYTGATVVNAGVLLVDGTLSTSSAVSVANAATVSGSGTIGGTVSVASGGIVVPGSSIGTMTVGGLSLASGSQLNFEFDGTNNDQITVTSAGGLTVNGGNLFLFNNGALSAYSTNGTYTLFNINGGFSGALSNFTVSNPAAGKFYSLTNSPASGIQLTIGTATTVNWNGNVDGSWSNGGNWVGGVSPNAVGTSVRFNGGNLAGAAQATVAVDGGGKTASGVIFNDDSSGTSFNINGPGVLTLNNGVAAGAITVFNGSHTISSEVSLAGALAVGFSNNSALTISGNVTGARPITVSGPGSLTFSGTNGFTTVGVSESTVNVGSQGGADTTGSLGSGPVTLSNNAVLNFNRSNAYNFGQNITGSGTTQIQQLGAGTTTVGNVSVTTLNIGNGRLITGSIAQSGKIEINGSGGLTANGAISGAGSLQVNTTGSVSLAAANSYTGGTQIDSGTVILNAAGALPANSALTVNGGVLDLNTQSIAINNIAGGGGVITNNGAAGSVATINFTGDAASYTTTTAINDGAGGGKLALVSTIQNANAGNFHLDLHSPSTYSGGTRITRQSIEAYASGALGTGSVVLQANAQSVNQMHLGVADGVTLANAITIEQPNASGLANVGGNTGAIQFIGGTAGNATLTGSITVLDNPISAGLFGGPTDAGAFLNVNGPVTAAGTATSISVRVGNVKFAGGGSYPLLDIFSNAALGANNGIATNAVMNVIVDATHTGSFDALGFNQTVAGLTGSGLVTNTSSTASTLTLQVAGNHTSASEISGTVSLVKTGTGTQRLSGATNYTGTTTVNGGRLILQNNNATSAWTAVFSGAGADVKAGRLIFEYTGGAATPAGSISTILKAGYAQSPKFSSGAIRTSNPQVAGRALGWRDDGVSQVSVAYTYQGDADLDGDADGVDIGTWATNFTGELSGGASATRIWSQGDWDYDGDVDGVDAGLWATVFTGELSGGGLGSVVVTAPINPQASAILEGLGITVVPEPANAGLIGLCLAGGLARRSRRRSV